LNPPKTSHARDFYKIRSSTVSKYDKNAGMHVKRGAETAVTIVAGWTIRVQFLAQAQISLITTTSSPALAPSRFLCNAYWSFFLGRENSCSMNLTIIYTHHTTKNSFLYIGT
jgi:hypothetical protein